MQTRLHDILKKHWGFDSFRYPQDEIIGKVLLKQDVLAILPTGGGKSLCYQVPAIAMEGLCLVISPLIALMEDQISRLRKSKVKAAYIHSGLKKIRQEEILSRAVNAHYDLLYMSPERLLSKSTLMYIRNMNLSFLAVDEAHCICEWGYDFRPAYKQIVQIRKVFPNIPILALTASATPDVQNDIVDSLQFRQRNIISTSLSRPNLGYFVVKSANKEQKLRQLCIKSKGSGIVYFNSRAGTERLAYMLNNANVSADFFHAGLSPEERSKKQSDWQRGKTRIIVATNAFGMGIDKGDVRFVLHVQMPWSLESYYQESGRAGRDGLASKAILLYNENDKRTILERFKIRYPELRFLQKIYKYICVFLDVGIGPRPEDGFDFDLDQFIRTFGLHKLQSYYAIKMLEANGWIGLSDAYHNPSLLKFIVDRRTLYDLQLRNENLNVITKLLLRSYEGLFTEMARISEKYLAEKLKISIQDVKKYLEILDRQKIINYKPSSTFPQLFFTADRIRSTDLDIDKKKVEHLKSMRLRRLNYLFEYLDHSSCREHYILSYFGQHLEKYCGRCDLCIERRIKHKKNQFEQFKTDLILALKASELNKNEIPNRFQTYNQNQIANYLNRLQNEEVIEIFDSTIRLK